MNHTSPEHSSDLREYLRVLRNRKWSIVIITGIVLAAALFFSFRQTPVYEGRAQVLVQSFSANPTQPAPPPDLITEQTLVATPAVAAQAAELLDPRPDLDALLAGLRVEVVSTSRILEISYASTDPQFAADAANAFATGYIRFRIDQFRQQVDAALENVQSRIDSARQRLTQLARQISATDDPEESAALNAERDILLARLGVLEGEREDLQGATVAQQGAGQVVDEADVPGSPSSPNHVRNAVLALLVGLALGTGTAFLRERLDDSIRDHQELERRMGAPVLATIPRISGWRRREDPFLISVEDPKDPVSEAYRTLRTNIQFLASRGELQTLLITSATAGDGKTATAVNLAVVSAQAGRRTVLLSADLRRPRLHRFLGGHNKTGLSLALSDSVSVWDAIQPSAIDNLRVVASGPVPPNPAELLQSGRMEEILGQLREDADLIIIDTPPVLAVADASILAAKADGTLFVVDAETARRGAAAQSRDQLENSGANLIGSVLNNYDPSQSGAYPNYYYYYSRYGGGLEGPGSEDGDGGPKGLSPGRSRRRSRRSSE